MTKQSTLSLGMVTVGIVVAVAAFLMLASQALAAPTVAVTDGTAPIGGGQVSVAVQSLDVNPGAAKVGSYNVEVHFDPTAFSGNPTFASNPAGDCNFTGSGVLRCAGAAGTSGVQGDLATLTFTTTAAFTGCTDLTVTVNEFNDAAEGNPLNPGTSPGQICLAEVTDTPSPTASGTATASASATATAVPAQPAGTTNTGGPLSGTNGMTWLLAIAGLAIVAAGAWTLSRANREN